jgi:hypothetical protein
MIRYVSCDIAYDLPENPPAAAPYAASQQLYREWAALMPQLLLLY